MRRNLSLTSVSVRKVRRNRLQTLIVAFFMLLLAVALVHLTSSQFAIVFYKLEAASSASVAESTARATMSGAYTPNNLRADNRVA